MTTNPKKDKRTHADSIEILGAIGPGSALREPDYDAMWKRMEAAMVSDKSTPIAQTGCSAALRSSSRVRLRRIALATTLGAALAAVPAYAAIQYDWSGLLHGRESIQEALKQGLGQEINRSVTHDGVTLTLHTAVIEEGHTLILYSLKGDKQSVQNADFSKVWLQSTDGEVFEARSTRTFDTDKNGEKPVTGYFETEWSPSKSSESQAVTLSAEGLTFRKKAGLALNFDLSDLGAYKAEVGKAGVDYANLQAFDQEDGQIMIRTTLMPQKGQTLAPAAVSLAAFDRNGQAISPSRGGIYGTPDGQGGFANQEYFSATDLKQSGVTYKLTYEQTTDRIDTSWTFPLVLDRSKMAHASIEQKLDLAFGDGDSMMKIRKLTITPTRIRVDVRQEQSFSPSFNEYRLLVDGREISREPGWFFDRENPEHAVLVLERPAYLKLTADSVIELRAKNEIIRHKGDLPTPILLQSISPQKQELSTEVGGYPVKWTYFEQNGNLVISASSTDPNFGGIGQMYIAEGSKRKLADDRNARIWGDVNNLLTEIYKNYSADSAELHIFSYVEHLPEQQVQVKLYPSK